MMERELSLSLQKKVKQKVCMPPEGFGIRVHKTLEEIIQNRCIADVAVFTLWTSIRRELDLQVF